ncbi:hypothetical protein [Yinghuangia aomiensis]
MGRVGKSALAAHWPPFGASRCTADTPAAVDAEIAPLARACNRACASDA